MGDRHPRVCRHAGPCTVRRGRRERGPGGRERRRVAVRARGRGPEPREAAPLTELALAEELVARHAEVLRYVRAWKTWLHFEGPRWARDATGAVERFYKDLVRWKIVAALDVTDAKQQKAL